MESSGLLLFSSIFLQDEIPPVPPDLRFTVAASSILIWCVTWFLVSTLGRTVRERERLLVKINDQLQQANYARNHLMIRTAHDLKAPFAGIETCIGQLRFTYWDTLPEVARDLVSRIEARSRILRERIGEILFLGGLRSRLTPDEEMGPLDIENVIMTALGDVSDYAGERGVQIKVHTDPFSILGRGRQLTALVANILSNAVAYSPSGSTVEISSSAAGRGVLVSVMDQGIEIPEDEGTLPREFMLIPAPKTASCTSMAHPGAERSSISVRIESSTSAEVHGSRL